MEQYKKYFGVMIFVFFVVASIIVSYLCIQPQVEKYNKLNSQIAKKNTEVKNLQDRRQRVEEKKKKIATSMASVSKRVFSPAVSDLENETLFFTLCNDVLEMLHANSVKIKSIDYQYNPENDSFVKFGGKEKYFVCNLNLELISNYENLGKFIQDVYQYPYYIKINKVTIAPYAKDKTVLITKLSLSLYAHTSPDEGF